MHRIKEYFLLVVLFALGNCSAGSHVPVPQYLCLIVLGISDSRWRNLSPDSLAPVIEALQQRLAFLTTPLQTLKFIGGSIITNR
jgi:hypothetical protein